MFSFVAILLVSSLLFVRLFFVLDFLDFFTYVRLFQNWATFLLFFQFPLLTRRNSPFHNISTIYGSNTFCSPARSPLNYCLANVTFLPLSAKVLIHHHLRLLPNVYPAASLHTTCELSSLASVVGVPLFLLGKHSKKKYGIIWKLISTQKKIIGN